MGLNCATGPEFMTDHIRTIHELSKTRVSCYPNAGLPNEEGKYDTSPTSLASQLEKFVDHGWLNIIGGCCGTTPEHIEAISQMVQTKQPRGPAQTTHRAYFSGVTHGSGQVQTNTAGIPIVLYMPSQVKVNGFVRKQWKSREHDQSLQLNVENLLNDTKLYGLIYNPPITAKLTYEIAF